MAKQLVLVEDDEVIRENYIELLSDEGFEVIAFGNRRDAMVYFEKNLPDLVLLDITLEQERDGGFQLCTLLRARAPALPILFLTSHYSDMDRISGLRLGADDYLTKDISMAYLVVRIETLLRRIETLTSAGQSGHAAGKTFGALTLDSDRLTVFWQDQPVDLTLTQYWIVQNLALNTGQVRSYHQLMKAAHIVVEPNTISAHIKTIRDRFKAIDREFRSIKTERGIGYRWSDVCRRQDSGRAVAE
jgi:two-component system OmpR family response regulator